MGHQSSFQTSWFDSRVTRFLFVLGLLAFIVGTTSTQIYKWIDKEGNVHFGDSPPAEATTQQIEAPPSPSSEEVQRAQERAQQLIEEQKAKKLEWERKRELERIAEELRKEELAKKCRIMHSRLFMLLQPGVMTFADAEGNLSRPSDDDRERMIEEIRAFIESNCTDSASY